MGPKEFEDALPRQLIQPELDLWDLVHHVAAYTGSGCPQRTGARAGVAVSDRGTLGGFLHNSLHNLGFRAHPLARKPLILNIRRDVRVVEGARLESEFLERHQATPKRLNAHGISDLTFQTYYPVCVRKPRCSSRF
jgi:hypothetical protein